VQCLDRVSSLIKFPSRQKKMACRRLFSTSLIFIWVALCLCSGTGSAQDTWIKVEGISHHIQEENDVLCLELNRDYVPRVHVLTHKIPLRIFFDIKPVKAYSGTHRIEPDSKLIDAIRTGYHAGDDFLRVVIDFRVVVPLEFKWVTSAQEHRTCLHIHEQHDSGLTDE